MADKDSREGKAYASPEILRWVARVHAAHDAGLTRAFDAPEREGIPAIQVGASEGRMLELFVRLCGARKVVEVGTLAGYSALRMARALPAGGRLFTIENDPRHAAIARANVEAAGLADRVEVLAGDAREVLDRLAPEGPFDLVFVDADKRGYAHYGRWAAANLRAGGLLVGDNVYLFGRLLDDTEDAAAMRAFHEEAALAFDSVVIPTPDGMLLGLKR